MSPPEPTDPDDREDRLGDAVEAYLELAEAGSAPDPEEFAAGYPDLADELREALQGLALVQGLAGGPGRQLEAGRRVAGYRIVRELGRGGMGVVYEAVHVDLDRPVALKVLGTHAPHDSSGHRRFLNEARTAAALHHTHIVPVFDVGRVGDLCYYAMQRIEGSGLDRVLKDLQHDRTTAAGSGSDRPRPESGEVTAPVGVGAETALWTGEPSPPGPSGPGRRPDEPPAFVPPRGSAYYLWVAQVGRQAAEALAYAHRRGVIHRDIKPSNLLVDARGTIWVADFGLARRIGDPGLTQTGGLLGTPRYMSPEQAEGDPIDGRSDVYSLGATLYELLALRPPFDGKTVAELIQQIHHREPTPPRRGDPRLPRDLETVVLKAMAKRPADRYATAAELAADLERFRNREPVRARRIGPLGRLWRFARRNPALAAVSTAATVAVLGIAIVAYVRVVQQRDVAIRAYRNQLLSEASVLRLSTVPDRRERGLGLLKAAAALGPEPALRALLRDEAVKLLSLRDVEALRPAPASGKIQGVAFGPGGTRLATLSEDGAEFGLWDLARPKRLAAHRVRTGPAVAKTKAGPGPGRGRGPDRQPRLAAAGPSVAVIRADGRGLLLFDATTGAPARDVPIPGREVVALLAPPVGGTPAASAAPGGPLLVTIERVRAEEGRGAPQGKPRDPGLPPEPRKREGGGPGDGFQVILRDLEHADVPRPIPIELPGRTTDGPGRFPPPLVAVGPGGDLIATAWPRDSAVSLWSGRGEARGRVVTDLQISAVALGPDGLMAAAGDGVIKLWRVEGTATTPRPLPGLSPHQNVVGRLRFSPGGALLAVAGRGPSVELWDLAAGALVATLPTPEGVNDLDFAPDGRRLAAAGPAGASVWTIVEPQGRVRLPEFEDSPKSLAFRPDGMLAVVLRSGGLRTWNPDRGPTATGTRDLAGLGSVTFDAFGRLIVLDSTHLSGLPLTAGGPAPGPSARIELPPWDDRGPPRAPRPAASPSGDGGPPRPPRTAAPRFPAEMARTADGRTLVLVRQDRAWICPIGPAGALGPLRPVALPGPTGPGRDRDRMFPPWRSVAVSPAGDRLYLSNVADEFVACALEGEHARRLEWAVPARVTALALGPDGSTLALGDPTGAVTLIDTADGSLRPGLPRPAVADEAEAEGAIRALAFAPDGRILAIGTLEQVRLWTLAAAPEPLVRLPGHRGAVTALAFDAAGRRLATGGEDRLIEVWDLDGVRRELGRLGLGW
jgi:serine/threonine protein kinase/WD40 repeat protein